MIFVNKLTFSSSNID